MMLNLIVTMINQHQEAHTAAALNAERARFVEWDAEVRSDWSSKISLGPHRSLDPGPHASGGPGRSVEGKRSGGARGFGPLQPAGYEPR